jgi:hypothetical protein
LSLIGAFLTPQAAPLSGGRLALLLVVAVLAAGYAPLGYYANVSRHRADSALSVSPGGSST